MSTRTAEERREAHRAACARYNATHKMQRNADSRAYHATHREERRAYDATRPEYAHWKDARRRAQAAGVPCTLILVNVRALLAPMLCSVTGLKLERGKGRTGPLSPSLDRIVPALGYVPGNVRLVCHRFNSLRKDAHVSRDAEFRARVLAELGEVQA